MDQPQRLQIGDRVRLLRERIMLPMGTAGTIRRVFVSGQLYDVAFDARNLLRVIPGDQLEPERMASEDTPFAAPSSNHILKYRGPGEHDDR
jgi:hypothetical protein